MTQKSIRFHEVQTLEFSGEAASRVDRANRVIRGVKILGLQSRNSARVLGVNSDQKYSYAPEAIAEAQPLYEGIGVYVDHPKVQYDRSGARQVASEPRKTADRFGRIVNVRSEPSGLFGDLEYIASHPLAEFVCETAERMPEQLAMSQNAFGGPTVKPDGRVVIERISSVESVDVIGEKPGTTSSLFESQATLPEETTVKLTVKKILESHGPASVGAANLASVLEMDDMATMGELPVDVPEEMDAEGQMRAAFRSMVMSVLDDESLDAAAQVAKVKEILAARDKLLAPEVPAEDPAPATEAEEDTEMTPEEKAAAEKDAATKESLIRLKRENAELKAEKAARALIESHNVDLKSRKLPLIEATAVRVKAVASLTSEADRKELVRTWESVAPTTERPRSAPPSVLNRDKASTPDGKGFASRIKG